MTIWSIHPNTDSRIQNSVRNGSHGQIQQDFHFHLFIHIVSMWEWLSSATVINICISIVITWLNSNGRVSGLAQQFPLCFKTNIHTYWCFKAQKLPVAFIWSAGKHYINTLVLMPYLSFLRVLLLHFGSLIPRLFIIFFSTTDLFFSNSSSMTLGVAVAICWSVHEFGLDWCVLTI